MPVLVLSGLPPRPQVNCGALQDIVHTDLVRSITRYARTVRQPELVLQELDEAVSRAMGEGGEPGPVYLDFPIDTQRAEVPRAVQLPEHFAPKPTPAHAPDPAAVQAAVDLLWSAKRPLVISGRGAQGAGPALCRLVAALRDALPTNAALVADGGDFLSFARVGLPATTYLDPGSLGCIGVGTPFGLAASLACPDRTVVVATGDGAFGFNAMELDSAVRHKAPVLVVVANNGAWAVEVRDQQETHGKVCGTRLQFSVHAAMARAFGMHAERVEKAEDLPAAIERALANRPALLDVLVTPEAASSDAKSGLAWVPDLQPLAAWDEAERRWRGGNGSA